VIALYILWAVAEIFVVAIVLLFALDAALRLRLNSDVSVSIETGSANNGTLIVYLPGILSGGRASSVDLIDVWRRHSDRVMLVEYGDNRFDGEFCARAVSDAIKRQAADTPFRRIVFIASSMGGLLADDVIRQLKLDDSVSTELILLDAPTSASDLQAFNGLIARVAPPILRMFAPGPISNQLNLVGWLFVPPKDENVEPGVNRAELARRVKAAGSYRLSFWHDQLVYITSHGAPKADSLEGRVDRLVYVRSTRDHDTVRPEAYKTWASTTRIATRKEVDSTHVGFAERPKTWQQAFEELLS